MRREDLFVAIGEIEDRHIVRCEQYGNPSSVVYREGSSRNRPGYIRRIWLIAAIIALMLLLMGSAIDALVTMHVEKTKMFGQGGKYQENEDIGFDEIHWEDTAQHNETLEEADTPLKEVYEGEKISFDEVHDVFLELGTYYPQQIPDGYSMTFVSGDAPLQNQVIHYENDAGNLIKFWIYIGDPASNVEVYEIEEKTEVDINGLPGILYKQKGGSRMLVWMDERQGYGFVLYTTDVGVDVLSMAGSTAEGEPLTPTRSGETLKALEELGDFSPEYLPEGFEELEVQGSPLYEGGGWYSYVRRWYVNKTENTNIYFEYETYTIVTEDGYTDDTRTVCSFFMPKNRNGEIVGEEMKINGMFGMAGENDVVWADPETHKVYHLHSKHITGDELLKVAQSVCGKA